MSQRELIDAYREGGLSRRTLIRRLVGSGVSLGAAVSYAHLFAPRAESAVPSGQEEFYKADVSLRLLTNTCRGAAKNRELRVAVTTNEPVTLTMRAFVKVNGKLRRIGYKEARFARANTRRIPIRLNDFGVKLLDRRDRSWVKVTAWIEDDNGRSFAKTTRVLNDFG